MLATTTPQISTVWPSLGTMSGYPPDQQDGAVQLILEQAQALGEAWGS